MAAITTAQATQESKRKRFTEKDTADLQEEESGPNAGGRK
jgi:hypothetical protein